MINEDNKVYLLEINGSAGIALRLLSNISENIVNIIFDNYFGIDVENINNNCFEIIIE